MVGLVPCSLTCWNLQVTRWMLLPCTCFVYTRTFDCPSSYLDLWATASTSLDLSWRSEPSHLGTVECYLRGGIRTAKHKHNLSAEHAKLGVWCFTSLANSVQARVYTQTRSNVRHLNSFSSDSSTPSHARGCLLGHVDLCIQTKYPSPILRMRIHLGRIVALRRPMSNLARE